MELRVVGVLVILHVLCGEWWRMARTLAVPPTRCYSSPAWTFWAPRPAAVWLSDRLDVEPGADDECGRSKQQRLWRRVHLSSTLSPYRYPESQIPDDAAGLYVQKSKLMKTANLANITQQLRSMRQPQATPDLLTNIPVFSLVCAHILTRTPGTYQLATESSYSGG